MLKSLSASNVFDSHLNDKSDYDINNISNSNMSDGNIDKSKIELKESSSIYFNDEDNINNGFTAMESNNNEPIMQEKGNEKETILNEYNNFTSEGEIYSITYLNNIAIIGDGSDITYFYNTQTKTILKQEKYNKESVNFLKLSSDNKFLLSTSLDGVITLFKIQPVNETSSNTTDFTLYCTITDQDEEINWIEWHPKGLLFSFGTVDGGVYVYLVNSSLTNMSFYNHTQSSTCGGYSYDGLYLISGSNDCTCSVYDLKQKSLVRTIEGNNAEITCMAISSKKTIFVIGSVCNEIQFMSYDKKKILYYHSSGNDEHSIESIVLCNDEKYCCFADSNCHMKVFDINTMQIRASLDLEDENITKIQCSSKNDYFVYGSGSNGHFYVIDTRSKCSIKMKIKLHSDVIMDYFIDKNESFVLTSSLDKKINRAAISL